jgi:hypothetical protein
VLVAYREIESNLGLGKNDPAGASAALVAGCVAAHQDVAISDAAFAAVVGQVQRAISAEPRLFHGLRVDRASVAEQMAIIGMMMMTQRGNQDAASVSGAKLDHSTRRAVPCRRAPGWMGPFHSCGTDRATNLRRFCGAG